MYTSQPSFILGFHGCDRSVADAIVQGSQRLQPSTNRYDWLGHGVYFWENSPQRAMQYACMLRDNPRKGKTVISVPCVLGAIIDLGCCLNLLDENDLVLLREAYELLVASSRKSGTVLPVNQTAGSSELLLRNLDCAVIESLHTFNVQMSKRAYDSVRGVFFEGTELYPGAGFRRKNHIQVCVRNPNCIKGYFRPMTAVADWPVP